ncbi:DUF6093 family protein [Streptomyces sp. NPDC046866]|uniref:DUF6093 family protein n=1 Tax=Streptomyces sp. NPDC046866 TaxID=3154921 RepID=UPI003456F1B1
MSGDLEAALTAGRAAALELMRETVTILAPSEPDFDWDTGTETTAPMVTLYSGPARVKPDREASGREVDAGETNVSLHGYLVSLPWSTSGTRPPVGSQVRVDSSPEARMAGLRLWVTGVRYGSTATAWRITAEDRS